MLLSIIKIVLIALLVLLVVLLVLIAFLLFMPIGYGINGSFLNEKLDGEADFSIFLGVISGRLVYKHGELAGGYIRLFGAKVYTIEGKRE